MAFKKHDALERRSFKFSMDSFDEEAGTFTGYASVFNGVDSYGDTVLPGAFKKTIRLHREGKFPLTWSHNQLEPLGVIYLEEDDKGLKVVQGDLNQDVQRAREIRSLAKQGAVTGLSIGFRAVKYKLKADNTGRDLAEIALSEVGLCLFPSDEEAQVDEMRCDGFDTVEQFLRDTGPWEERATWDSAYVNALPNAAFAVVEKGYKDGDDKGARHLPHHTKGVTSPGEDSTVDLPHLRAALARANQVKSVLGTETDAELRSKAEAHLQGHADRMGVGKAAVDELELKPYPNEHACRLRDPGNFSDFRRGSREHEGKKYGIIFGKEKDGGAWAEQSYRYPKDTWTAAEAAAHCKSHKGQFEAAAKCEDCLYDDTEPGTRPEDKAGELAARSLRAAGDELKKFVDHLRR